MEDWKYGSMEVTFKLSILALSLSLKPWP